MPTKNVRLIRVHWFMTLCLFGLWSCGGGSDNGRGSVTPPPPPPAPTVATVSVSPTSGILSVGGTLQLTATPRDAGGNAVGASVIWSSGTPAVASISNAGVVTAMAPGTTIIIAEADGKQGTAVIDVAVPPAQSGETLATVTLGLPAGTSLTAGQLQLSAGLHAAGIVSSGTASANIPTTSTGVVAASTRAGNPVLLSVTSGGREAIVADGHSTAQALAFLNPGLATSDPDSAQRVLEAIRADAGLAEIQRLYEARLRAGPETALTENDPVLAAAINVVVESVMKTLGLTVSREAATSAALQSLGPIGATQLSGVTLSVLGTNSVGQTQVELKNTRGRWLGVAVSSSSDGQNFSSASENALVPFVPRYRLFPRAIKATLLGVNDPTVVVPLPAGRSHVRVKTLGLGKLPEAAFDDPDGELAVFPAVGTVVFSLFLPVVESVLGVRGLARLPIWVGDTSPGVIWLKSATSCAVQNNANLLRDTFARQDWSGVGVTIGLCAFKGLLDVQVLSPLIAAVAPQLALSIASSAVVPLKVGLVVYSLTKNVATFGLGVAALLTSNSLETFDLRDDLLVAVGSVAISPSYAAMGRGQRLSLAASVRDGTGAPLSGRQIAWTSSAPATASIDGAGRVSAIAAGRTTITATEQVSGKVGTAVIEVLNFVAQPSAAVSSSAILAKGGATATLSIDVAAFSENGQYVQQLPLSAFTIAPISYGGGTVTFVPTGISQAPSSAAGPFSTSIVIDQSGSMSSSDPSKARLAAARQFAHSLAAGDEVAIYTFSDQTTQVLSFTSNPAAVDAAINAIGNPTGSTRLFDSGVAACSYTRSSGRNMNRHVILVTDGDDNVSSAKSSDLIAACKSNGVRVSTLGFAGSVPTVLATIARETGGLASSSPAPDYLLSTFRGFADVFRGTVAPTRVTFQATAVGGLGFRSSEAATGTVAVDIAAGIAPRTALSAPQLATATVVGATFSATVSVARPVTTVAMGDAMACAIVMSGGSYCWGTGTLGDGSASKQSVTPVAVVGGSILNSIWAGWDGACGLSSTGKAYCWGSNNTWGQLGVGTFTDQRTIQPVSGNLSFKSLTLGGNAHACGLSLSGAAYCWGYNGQGQLGDGTQTNRPAPVPVATGTVFQSIAAGGVVGRTGLTCAISTSGDPYCWGIYDPVDGIYTRGVLSPKTTTPTLVPGGWKFAQVAAGTLHVCALDASGSAFCWGDNSYGQLGNGTTATSVQPVAVSGSLRFTQLALTWGTSCGLATTGAAYCWGNAGSVGDGSGASNRTVPTLVAGNHRWKFITGSSGQWSTCGISTDDLAYCWGLNLNGQLGQVLPVGVSSSVPVLVLW